MLKRIKIGEEIREGTNKVGETKKKKKKIKTHNEGKVTTTK